MDEMKLTSGFTTGIISKIITKQIAKSLGGSTEIKLNSVSVSVKDGMVNLHVDVDGKISTQEVMNLLTKNGL